MQYTEIFKVVKNENFQKKNFDIFLIFAQNIDCRYTLEPPRPGGSNEYPQSMFWSKNKKNRYTPAYPSFTIQKWGSRGYTCHGHVFLMKRSMNSIKNLTNLERKNNFRHYNKDNNIHKEQDYLFHTIDSLFARHPVVVLSQVKERSFDTMPCKTDECLPHAPTNILCCNFVTTRHECMYKSAINGKKWHTTKHAKYVPLSRKLSKYALIHW